LVASFSDFRRGADAFAGQSRKFADTEADFRHFLRRPVLRQELFKRLDRAVERVETLRHVRSGDPLRFIRRDVGEHVVDRGLRRGRRRPRAGLPSRRPSARSK
jgi:hypothetical protein